MTSWPYHVTQTKHGNRQAMETKDRYLCKESLINGSFSSPPLSHGYISQKSPLWIRLKNFQIFVSLRWIKLREL